MYKKELDTKLRNNKVPRAMLLLGDNDFFIDYYGKKIAQNFAKESEINKFYYDEFDINKIISVLSQPSLFGGENIVLIKHGAKLTKKDLVKLLNIVEKFSYAYLIVELFSLDSRKQRDMMSTAILKSSDVVRFFMPNNNSEMLSEYLPILREKANLYNLNLDNSLYLYLLNIHSNSIELAISDIEKLSLLDKSDVTKEDINLMCLGSSKVDIDDFIYETLANNIDLSKEIKNLQDENIEPFTIITRFESIINELLLIHLYIKSTGSSSMKEVLGYEPPRHIAKKKIDIALSLKEIQYESMLKEIFTYSLEIMRANIEKDSILIAFLIKLQGLIRNN